MGDKPHVKPVYAAVTRDLACPRCQRQQPHHAAEHDGAPCWKCAHCRTLHRNGQVLWKGGRKGGGRGHWGRPTPALTRYLRREIQALRAELETRADAWGLRGRPRDAR